MTYNFDTSSIIHLWDNYPIDNEHFGSLWNWFFEKVEERKIVISDVAHAELMHKLPELFENQLQPKSIVFNIYNRGIEDLSVISNIKHELGILEDNYHPKGVGENDLFIIPIAKKNNHVLVSNEGLQKSLPDNKVKYKIPAVCKLPIVNIECIDLLTLFNLKI